MKLFVLQACLIDRTKNKGGKNMFFGDRKAKEKEQKIEEILCEKYNSYYRMAYSYTKNEEDAADIVQEGAYKAMRYSDSLKNIEYAETWIYRIMVNEIFRLLGNKKEVSIEMVEITEPSTEDVYEDIDLQNAIETMNPQDRAVIQLRFFEDMPLDEIARVLDENVSTIKSRLYRGLKKLRLELSEED